LTGVAGAERDGRLIGYQAERAFDGERILRGGALVLVRGTRIVGVEPAGTAAPAGCEVIDYPGATILPGLIDTHVHLCADGRPDALVRDPARTVAEREAVVRAALGQQLRAGVTAVRDLGDHQWTVVDRTHHDDEPTIAVSGPPITIPGGHCWTMGGEAQGQAQLRRAVAERAERKVGIVKIVVSGGAMTAGSDLLSLQYSAADVAFVVEHAHRAGLPVTAHAHSLAAVEACVEAGVDGIEHCTCLTERGLRTPPALVEALAAAGVQVCPTFGRVPGSVPSPQAIEVSERTGLTVAGRFAQVAGLHRGGVSIVSGTDAGIHPGKPHGVLRYSVAEHVQAAMTPAQALASATSVAALACGLQARTGRLSPGLDADLLVVDGDPTTDITDLEKLRAVVSRGRSVALTDEPRPPRN
jgi:imidazolonepropionase-like amidohydrolase